MRQVEVESFDGSMEALNESGWCVGNDIDDVLDDLNCCLKEFGLEIIEGTGKGGEAMGSDGWYKIVAIPATKEEGEEEMADSVVPDVPTKGCPRKTFAEEYQNDMTIQVEAIGESIVGKESSTRLTTVVMEVDQHFWIAGQSVGESSHAEEIATEAACTALVLYRAIDAKIPCTCGAHRLLFDLVTVRGIKYNAYMVL